MTIKIMSGEIATTIFAKVIAKKSKLNDDI